MRLVVLGWERVRRSRDRKLEWGYRYVPMQIFNRTVRAVYRRLGIIHVGRRRVRDLMDFIESREISTVVDVGANIGQFGESLRADGYRGRIVSFEPTGSAFQILSPKAALRQEILLARVCALPPNRSLYGRLSPGRLSGTPAFTVRSRRARRCGCGWLRLPD